MQIIACSELKAAQRKPDEMIPNNTVATDEEKAEEQGGVEVRAGPGGGSWAMRPGGGGPTPCRSKRGPPSGARAASPG